MTTFDYQAFRASRKYKVPKWLWAAGFIVASPGQLLATFLFHNRLEANILFVTGLAMMLPFGAVLIWVLHKGRQAIRRLEVKLIVYDTLLELANPKEYKRQMDIRDIERLFKK